MEDLKVGDPVIISYEPHKGLKGVISAVDRTDYCYRVKHGDGGIYWYKRSMVEPDAKPHVFLTAN